MSYELSVATFVVGSEKESVLRELDTDTDTDTDIDIHIHIYTDTQLCSLYATPPLTQRTLNLRAFNSRASFHKSFVCRAVGVSIIIILSLLLLARARAVALNAEGKTREGQVQEPLKRRASARAAHTPKHLLRACCAPI